MHDGPKISGRRARNPCVALENQNRICEKWAGAGLIAVKGNEISWVKPGV